MPVYIISAEQLAKNQQASVYWVIAVALLLAAAVGYIIYSKKKKR